MLPRGGIRQAGFTLVELVIGMAITAAILGGTVAAGYEAVRSAFTNNFKKGLERDAHGWNAFHHPREPKGIPVTLSPPPFP